MLRTWPCPDGWPPYEADAKRVGMHARTPAICSCTMCGNPRRHFGRRARQEVA